MSYSMHLRKCAVKYRQEGHSLRETGNVFGVTAPIIGIWERKMREEGTLEDKPVRRTFRKLDPEKLKVFVSAHPDAYLREMAAEFHCAITTVRNALQRLGITRKKRRNTTKSRTRGK